MYIDVLNRKPLMLVIAFVALFFISFAFPNKIYSGCSTSCDPNASSCGLQTAPCGESKAGCASGRSEPAGQAYCCPYKVTCTCTPGTCKGCTPVCVSGQTTTVTGPLCLSGVNSKCTGSDGCNACTMPGSACYYNETNTSFVQSNGSTSGPASLTMVVDGTSYALSADSANPTVIKLPCATNVTVSVPAFTAPATSRGGGYYFQADNYGTSDQWKGWTTCSGKAPGEDFCIDSGASTSTSFTPSSLATSLVLKEGAAGQVSAQYYTINKCNDNHQYSTARVGYYRVETNTPVSAPASTNIIIDNVSYTLSSNPANPTITKIPNSVSGSVQLSEPAISIPAYSQSRGYAFSADNYGFNNEWLGGIACTGNFGEDFCIESMSNTQNFVPATKPLVQVLIDSAKGKITAKYYTTNRCGNNKQYSNAYNSYYQIDNEPTCVDCSTTIITDLNTDITARQCKSITYTGKDIHNPLHINVDIADANGLNDIQGLMVWFSKDLSTPSKVTISGTNPNSDVANDIGIFIRKNGATWTSPLMYGYDSTSTNWEQTTNGEIKNNSNEIALKLQNINIATGATSITFDLSIEFFPVTAAPQGIYHLFLNGIDTYMINSNSIDQSRLKSIFDWGIDLVDPVVEDIVLQVKSPTNTNLTWAAADTISAVDRAVINGYRVGGTETDLVKLYLPAAYTTNKGDLTLSQVPRDSEIGNYNDINAWKFDNNTGETDLLNIGANESGKIALYVTAYDKACNTNAVSEEIDLNPWFATRGGNVYSQGNISANPKDVSSVDALDGVFNPKTLMNKSYIDLGTELLSTRNISISNLMHSNQGAVKASLLYDSNNVKNHWFELLNNKFNRNRSKATLFTNITTSVNSDCPVGDICYLYSESDIAIPSGYVCNKPTLFIAKNDINIEPDITSSASVLSGCIFLAGNNINILDGSYKSNGSRIEYDYLEGYLVAENQINFLLVDSAQALRDGIEIFGGIVALGSTSISDGNAISIQRDLRLFTQTNPAVVLTYDNKYSNISTIFFGTDTPIYKQEVGFKSF